MKTCDSCGKEDIDIKNCSGVRLCSACAKEMGFIVVSKARTKLSYRAESNTTEESITDEKE